MSALRLTLATLVVASMNAYSADNLSAYQHEAHKLLENIEQKGAGIEQQAKQLVDLSKPLLADFKAKYPQCSEYLNALNAAADSMADLPLAEIEAGYHSDGLLPALPDANCYHAKDLLVHPATVQAMAKLGLKSNEDWEKAEEEIEEVIEHFNQVEVAYSE